MKSPLDRWVEERQLDLGMWCLRHPIATLCLMVGLLLAGSLMAGIVLEGWRRP